MRQLVTVHRCADRHADLHAREFAETHKVEVDAGPPARVVADALNELDLPEGRYSITVDWPYEREPEQERAAAGAAT